MAQAVSCKQDFETLKANVVTISYYARALWKGELWRGIRGDSGQLGGDFIIDTDGFVRLAYPSRNPTDRPPVEEQPSVIERMNQAGSRNRATKAHKPALLSSPEKPVLFVPEVAK